MNIIHDYKIDQVPPFLLLIPPIFILLAYLARKWYLARRLKLHGIGKGAPGFQTSVRQVRVTPEIAARLRRGEKVSQEEIEQASARENQTTSGGKAESSGTGAEKDSSQAGDSEANDSHPESATGPKPRRRGRPKKK